MCLLMTTRHMQKETSVTLPVTYPGRSITSTMSKLLCSLLSFLSPGAEWLKFAVHLHLMPRSRMSGALPPCPHTMIGMDEIIYHKHSLCFEIILNCLFLQMQESQLLEGRS
jgi:hypothetical protein